ncbi:MAG: molybdopterin molybdotransferase MoeA [Thermoplasmata archaeon]|nr:molybdopterin molybdotransferase MoeA [Thermoplasmata archaeon]
MNRKKMLGFKKYYSVEEALKEFKTRIQESKEYEIVNVTDSLNRFSFENVLSNFDLPAEDRSVVDGYAVRSIDVSGASPSNPIEISIVGKISAGEKSSIVIEKDQAIEIYTGGKLPNGSDCVVMAEDCSRNGDKLLVMKQCFKYQNVSRKGEDFSNGDIVIKKGTLIRPFHIGALVSCGVDKLKVFKKARVSVISTGSELKNISDEKDGIIDSTRPMIISALKENYAEPIDLGIVKDDLNEIKEKLRIAIQISDLVVITGGTSLGNYDLVPDAVESIAKPGIVVHGIAMRPARTTGIAFDGKIPIIMISGFPVAAYISFNLFFREFLKIFYGTVLNPVPEIKGKLTKRFPNPPGIRSFVRVRIIKKDNDYLIEPLRLTGSGILSTLTRANGIMVINENSEGYDENSIVNVEITQPIEEVNNDAKNIS